MDDGLHLQVVRVTIVLVPAPFLAVEVVIVMVAVVVIEIVDTLLIHDLALHLVTGIAPILALAHLLDLVIDLVPLVQVPAAVDTTVVVVVVVVLLVRVRVRVVVHTLDPVLDLLVLVPDLALDPLCLVKTII